MSSNELIELMSAMKFPEEVKQKVEEAMDGVIENVKSQLVHRKLQIREMVDLSTLIPDTSEIEKIVDVRLLINKDLKDKMDHTKSPVVPGERRKIEIENIINRRNNFIKEFQEKRPEYEESMKVITDQNKQIKELKRKKKELIKKEELKIIEEKKKQQEVNKEKKVKKVEEIKKRIEVIHNKNVQSMQLRDDWEQKYKETKATKEYAYQKLEKQFSAKIQKSQKQMQSDLKEHRKKVAMPVEKQGIEEHQQKYLLEKKVKEEKREEQKKNLANQFKQSKHQLVKYHNPIESLIEEEMKMYRNRESESKDMRRNKIEKMKKVAELMQDVHKPKVSEAKKQELEQLINKLSSKTKESQREAKSEEDSNNEEDVEGKRYPWRKYMSKNPKKEVVLPDIKKSTNYKDYLTEERIKNPKPKQDEKITIGHLLESKSISTQEKVERIKEKVRDMEVKAQRKVQLMNADNKNTNQELFREASDIYIDSIKAKLSLLDKIA